MKRNRNIKAAAIIALLIITAAPTCRKYLDARPDKHQVVPANLQDLQALLDNVTVMNRSFPNYGEAAADNYYLTTDGFNALPRNEDKSLYLWQADGIVVNSQWLSPYKVVYYANQVLESLGQIAPASPDGTAQIKGAALFFRAYSFLQVAGIFAPQYNAATSATDAGIPLRLTADFNPVSVRATSLQTYNQIVTDLKQAAGLLPLTSAFPSRPTRVAALATLSRVLLTMGDFKNSGLYADSCLAMGLKLMDFNTLNASAPNPIARFNQETLFYAMSSGANTMYPATSKVDSDLYRSYSDDDLRKIVFFKKNADGSHAFKGNYDGVQSATLFSGPATDEIYLNAAECSVRNGETENGMAQLNDLLEKRYRAGSFTPVSAANAGVALAIILKERRKELLFRNLRWTDLKRLNLEPGFKATLRRKLGDNAYQLEPGDLRYQFLIPQEVINQSGIAQNPR